MIRKIAILGAAVLALSVMGATAATAKTPPATGSLSCGLTGGPGSKAGAAILNPALTPSTPSTKNGTVKSKNAALGSCDTSGVSGGSLPINGGAASFSGVVGAGADCAALVSNSGGALSKIKFQLKLTNTSVNSKGKTVTKTVASVKVANVVFATDLGDGGFTVDGTILQNKAGTAAFGGDSVHVLIAVSNIGDFIGCLGGSNSVGEIDFASPSSVTLTAAP